MTLIGKDVILTLVAVSMMSMPTILVVGEEVLFFLLLTLINAAVKNEKKRDLVERLHDWGRGCVNLGSVACACSAFKNDCHMAMSDSGKILRFAGTTGKPSGGADRETSGTFSSTFQTQSDNLASVTPFLNEESS